MTREFSRSRILPLLASVGALALASTGAAAQQGEQNPTRYGQFQSYEDYAAWLRSHGAPGGYYDYGGSQATVSPQPYPQGSPPYMRETAGTIDNIDRGSGTITMEDGTRYRLSESVARSAMNLRPGQRVYISFEPRGDERVAMRIMGIGAVSPGSDQAGDYGQIARYGAPPSGGIPAPQGTGGLPAPGFANQIQGQYGPYGQQQVDAQALDEYGRQAFEQGYMQGQAAAQRQMQLYGRQAYEQGYGQGRADAMAGEIPVTTERGRMQTRAETGHAAVTVGATADGRERTAIDRMRSQLEQAGFNSVQIENARYLVSAIAPDGREVLLIADPAQRQQALGPDGSTDATTGASGSGN